MSQVKSEEIDVVTLIWRPIKIFPKTIGKIRDRVYPKPKHEVVFSNCRSVKDELPYIMKLIKVPSPLISGKKNVKS